ncbi:selenocysteine-specific translation elongation factor [Peptococcaceae bacterium 1198_IL3148]
MKHIIIGTAGHVDHGKSQLIKALTGIETDRLQEEKERGISIELGFAYLTLPSGRRAGIVDVPGHERFIKNMLAGVSGIDLVLLVIAADEGVMPQTREHFDILQLLQVKTGIVVLTKIDLVDPDWLELVKEEVKDFLNGTTLENAPLIAVSSVTKEGLPELLATIDGMVQSVEERTDTGKMRLPVDRVFSVTGFGTVVTGTMVSGRLSVGDEVVLMPTNIASRVRGLQVHGNKVDFAQAGQRVAVNLVGVEVEQIQRGHVVTAQGALTPSFRIDTKLHLLLNAPKALQHRTRVRLHIGTDEIMARVILLDRDELQPGADAYAQLQLEEPAVTSKGDRFVIRSYSPMHTIGGGIIIDALPAKHKRFKPEIIEALTTKEKGSPDELLLQFITLHSLPVTLNEAAEQSRLSLEDAITALNKLVSEDKIKLITAEGKELLLLKERYLDWSNQITASLKDYHNKFPLREGYPKEELRSRMFDKLSAKAFQYLLLEFSKDNMFKLYPQTIALPDFTSLPTGNEARVVATIESILKTNAFQPPNWKDVVKQVGLSPEEATEYQGFLLRLNKIRKIADDIYFHTDVLNQAKEKIAQYIKENGKITIAETRDVLNTSRKYALPLLECFDRERFTRRIGDDRVLGAKA